MLRTLIQDVRFGLRMLRKSPWFTAVAVLTLALGIGVNATVFTLVNSVLFKGLPFDEPDRIVSITSNNLARNQPQLGASYLDFLDWKAQSQSFAGLAVAQGNSTNLSDPGLPTEQYFSGRISTNTFSLMGVKPLLGRDFLPQEDQGAGVQVAILGYDLWQKRYGGDPKILGRVIRLNEIDTPVVGVMPPGMKFPVSQELWTPLFASGPASSLNRRDSRGMLVYGRLADGVSMAQAQSELDLIAKRLQTEYPQTNKGIGIRAMPYTEFFAGGQIRMLFLAMFGAVGFVLLIACANVANLLLARSIRREREVSIRAALGASRGRIVRQLLVESLLLGILGGVGGLLLSIWGVRAFLLALPSEVTRTIPYWMDFSMDYTVVGYLALICVATSILFGIAPALHATRVDLSRSLKEGSRGSGGGRARYLSRILVVGEVSLALVLLAGAGLMIRSFVKLYEMSASLNSEKVLTATMLLSGARYLTPEPRMALLDRLEPELATIPGVESIALTSNLPLFGALNWQLELEGQPPPADPNDRPSVSALEVSPQYFQVLGIAVLRGRTFRPADGRDGSAVVVVNHRFAGKYWPGEDTVGKRLRVIMPTPSAGSRAGDRSVIEREQPWFTVVGEVANVKQTNSQQAEMDPLIYVPYRQTQQTRGFSILAKSAGADGHSLTIPLRNAVQRVNSELPLIDIMTMPEHFARVRWFIRLFGSLFVIFAAIGLILAAVGIYAVMAYSVSQRTQEIGIRMAFGANQSNILGMVIRQGLKLAVIGVVIGVAGSFAVTRVLANLLVGVSPTDPLTFALVALLLTAIAILACYWPARRAAQVDPMLALRAE
ncbi:MAG: ABC transporter permease [Acidobacteria bacterium]|nr:ABC transporter permease [Acidobacteriota bacterium]